MNARTWLRTYIPVRLLRAGVALGALLLLVLSLLTQPVVISWTLLSAMGLALSVLLARESGRDLQLLPRQANGRRLTALGRLAREGVRSSIHFAFGLAGVIALGLPDFRDLIVPLLMYGNAATAANSLIDARLRFLLYATRDAEPEIPHEE